MRWLRRWRRACMVVVMVLVFLCLGVCLALAILVRRTHAQEIATPVDVVLLIDHSDSMWERGDVGSDPELLRVRAANLLLAYLGTSETSTDHRVGVIHFGGESELVAPLTPLDDVGQQRVQAAIVDPPRMGSTDPLAALNLAYETLFTEGRRDPARQPVLILLTDGKPELGHSPSSREMGAYLDDLRALADRFHERGCPVFTVALSNEAIASDPEIETLYRNLWQEIAARTPPASYHEAETAADLLPVCHTIVASLLGAQTDAPIIETAVSGQLTHTVQVEPDLAQVTLVALSDDPTLEMHLLRPGGAPARPSDPDVRHADEPEAGLSVWTVRDPRPGQWTVSLRGEGAVLAWQDVVPQSPDREDAYQIEVSEVPPHISGGEAITISASVRESIAGVLTDPSLRILGEVRRAGFVEATHLARDDGQGCDATAGDGQHCLTLSDLPPGVCTLLLRALVEGEGVAQRELAFEVDPPPPTPMPDPSITPSPAGTAQGHEDSRGPWPLLLIGLVGLIALASLGGAGWLLVRRRGGPRLGGRLRVLAAPSVQETAGVIDLPAQPSVTVGAAGKRSIPLPGADASVNLRAARSSEGDVETWIAPLAEESNGMIELNDSPLAATKRLRDGDLVTLGPYRLRYEDLQQASLHRSRHRPQRRAPIR